MTLNEYIKNLQEIQEQGHGDKQVIYAKDAEGNGFAPVYYKPTLGVFDGEDFMDDESFEDIPNSVCVN